MILYFTGVATLIGIFIYSASDSASYRLQQYDENPQAFLKSSSVNFSGDDEDTFATKYIVGVVIVLCLSFVLSMVFIYLTPYWVKQIIWLMISLVFCSFIFFGVLIISDS